MPQKPKSVPSRLGPPPQLVSHLGKIPIVQQQEKFKPKMREILAKQAKMLAKWAHEKMTWKKILMSWMVVLVASKMSGANGRIASSSGKTLSVYL